MIWVALILATAAPARGERPAHPKGEVHDLFDDASMALVRAATKVEVIRLQADESWAQGYTTALARPEDDNVGEFAVAYRHEVSDKALLKRLRLAALSESSYDPFEGGKMCGGFQPKVAFRFHGGGGAFVDLLLCFNCRDAGVIRADHAGSRHEGSARIAPFDSHRALWASLVQAALPDDPKVFSRGNLAK